MRSWNTLCTAPGWGSRWDPAGAFNVLEQLSPAPAWEGHWQLLKPFLQVSPLLSQRVTRSPSLRETPEEKMLMVFHWTGRLQLEKEAPPGQAQQGARHHSGFKCQIFLIPLPLTVCLSVH